jgi:hypothetical protein
VVGDTAVNDSLGDNIIFDAGSSFLLTHVQSREEGFASC